MKKWTKKIKNNGKYKLILIRMTKTMKTFKVSLWTNSLKMMTFQPRLNKKSKKLKNRSKKVLE